MSGSVLQVDDVRLSRGPREILAGARFSVAAGELVALMGPSGSGKTTLLRAIVGLEPFAAGRIVVGGATLAPDTRPSAARQALRGTVGMVFQFHCLFEHLPALTNVWLAPVHAHGMARPDAERRARALLDRFGVGHRAAALPRELSGGEAQRVAIARALAIDPSILLMDEPTASLDPERRNELAELLAGLGRERRTIVVATHDEEFARACATRILRIREGRVTPSPAG